MNLRPCGSGWPNASEVDEAMDVVPEIDPDPAAHPERGGLASASDHPDMVRPDPAGASIREVDVVPARSRLDEVELDAFGQWL